MSMVDVLVAVLLLLFSLCLAWVQTWQSLREGRIPPLAAAQPVLARAPTGRGSTG